VLGRVRARGRLRLCDGRALWEFAEYFTFIRNSPELDTAYTDTLGDLALGLSGSMLAALLTVTLLWPKAIGGRATSAVRARKPKVTVP